MAHTIEQSSHFPAGTRVLIDGLSGRTEYNGKRAVVLAFREDRGRFSVKLDDGEEILLEPQRLVREQSLHLCAAVDCNSDQATKLCSRCRVRGLLDSDIPRYCSKDCQVFLTCL